MQLWQTMFAAVGGMVLGLGLGVLLGRRRQQEASTHALDATRLRTTVIPVLERRASSLGIPPAERPHADAPPVAVAVSLATSIQRRESHEDLPFSDTVELSTKDLGR